MKATTVVFATCQVEGIHRWPNPPEKYAYLGTPHRHIFHARVCVEVGHSNRDVEFINLKQMLEEYFVAQAQGTAFEMHDFRGMSCEMMANNIACCFEEEGYRVTEIEVNEDGENGAIIRYSYEEEYRLEYTSNNQVCLDPIERPQVARKPGN